MPSASVDFCPGSACRLPAASQAVKPLWTSPIEADAYWADDVHVATGHNGEKFTIARITDTRDDAKLGNRPHEEVGTEYVVPPNKIVGFEQRLRGNPTGHTVIFLAAPVRFMIRTRKRDVICFVPAEMG
jgi:hypothetical protein